MKSGGWGWWGQLSEGLALQRPVAFSGLPLPLGAQSRHPDPYPENQQDISFPTHYISKGEGLQGTLSQPRDHSPRHRGFVPRLSLSLDPRCLGGREAGLKLTNKFWRPKNVLKFNSIFYFMSQAKVNQLDVWNGNILV